MKVTTSINGAMAWAIVVDYIRINKGFKSVTGIEYAAWVESTVVFYTGDNRNNGRPELINRVEFVESFDNIKNLKDINSNTIRNLVPDLYRKRSPFMGMLKSAGVIEE
jgi:hypothetical protein